MNYDPNYFKKWKTMNQVDERISEIQNVTSSMLGMVAESTESDDPDATLNSILSFKTYVEHLLGKLEADFKMAWDEVIGKEVRKNELQQGVWLSCVDDDGILTFPPDLLEKMGWDEGTELDLDVSDDGQTIVIREADYSSGGGCMGDTLTPEEEKVLSEEGLKGFLEMDDVWDK